MSRLLQLLALLIAASLIAFHIEAATVQVQICTTTPNSTAAGNLIGCPVASVKWGPTAAGDLTRTQNPAQTWLPFNRLTPSAQVVSSGDGQWHALNTLTVAPPPAVTNPVPPKVAAGAVQIHWTAPTENSDGSALADLSGYRVEHASSTAGPWDLPMIVVGGVTSTVYPNLATTSSHCFRVIAVSRHGDSLPSAAVCVASIPLAAPSSPGSPAAQWNASS